jgi:hypothetical protein
MSCDVSQNCSNNYRCFECSFDGNKYSSYGINLYAAIDKKIKHPLTIVRKQERKDAKKAEKLLTKKEKDKKKVSLLKKANKVEEIVKSTLNSGRINKDGDLRVDDLIIDVKLQSTRKDPIIKVDEFIKVNNDCIRANKQYGVLCIENKDGQRFYIISEELFSSKFI